MKPSPTDRVANEFCVGQAEYEQAERETHEALRVLDVTDSELT